MRRIEDITVASPEEKPPYVKSVFQKNRVDDDTETVGDAIGMGEQTTGLPEFKDKTRRHAFETVDKLSRSHPVETVASVENGSFSPGMGTSQSQRRYRKLSGIEMAEQKPQPIAIAAMRRS